MFSYVKQSKAGYCGQTRLESATSLRPGKPFISSPRHEYYDVFLVGKFFQGFGSGQSNVHSETSMTTCCVVNANMDSGDPGNQYSMTKHGSSYPQIVY